MYLKRLLAFLCCFTLVFCLFPSSAFATGGNGNIDGGGGSMGHGTSSNFWNSGNDGVRITVVDASSGTAVSSPLDFSNRTQKTSLLHFGKVNKLQYLGGAGLSLQSGVAYSCIRPTQSMPTIVSSKGQSNIEAIKRYFCSEYACMMVAQAAGVDYERMIAGEYKLLIEPIAYFTHNGQYYCMTATEAGLYDQMSGGNLRKTMTSLTHKNLPLSMFLEFSDLGISAWTGSTTGKQNNSDIISTLGVGIVWFDEAPPEGEIEAPDVEYRVDTDVITAVTLRTDQDLTPDNPASVTFHILGTTYRVNDIVIPAGDSQVVWVKWHTPSTPQTVTITVSVSGAYTAQDTFVAKIVDLNEHIPPDPVATDTNPGYSVPPLPSETQKLTANWGVWSCYWVPVWVWCDHGEDGGHWVDEGYWEYEYTGYSASISGEMSLMPDDIVPTASGKTMKSGYGVKTEVRATLSTDAPTSHITYPQTAFSVFPEFQYADVGVNASIRIVNQQTVSEEKLLNSGSATAEMLHFLTACIRYGVSVCIAGSTGSGKTTIMAWLLSNVPNNRRLITIEEGSREFDLVKRDAQGNILNSVVHLLTRPSENPALNINQDFLLERVLRKHPDVIGVGEMRSAAESLSAAESSRTGHTVCTTIHSNSCNSTYRRMMTLAKRKYNMDDSILMQIMVEAYPIIVFTKQLEDRSRKIMEIIEGEDYQDGRLIAHSLYKYEVEDNVTDDRGETRVVGHHKKIGLISDSLKKRLLDNGISNKELEEFMQPPKEVG